MAYKRFCGAVLAAVIAGGAGSAAHATIVEDVYTGQVEDGFIGSTDIGLDLFKAVFVFDDTKGALSQTGNYQSLAGGTDLGASNPTVSASLTVGGNTYDFSGAAASSYAAQAGFAYIAGVTDPNGDVLHLSAQSHDVTTLSAPGDYSPGSHGIYDGYFTGGDASAHLAVFDLTVSTISAAPEPGAWALMLAGVGAAGLTLRRRRAMGAAVSRGL